MKNRALDINRNLEIRYVSYTYTCTILWTKHLKMDLANVYICTCSLQGLQSIYFANVMHQTWQEKEIELSTFVKYIHNEPFVQHRSN